MYSIINESNTETSINDLESDDMGSKNLFFDKKLKSALGKLPLEEKKTKKKTNYNITLNSNNNKLKNSLGPSLYHMKNKINKKKKEIYKSTNNFFEKKDKREIQFGLKSIKIDDDISKKKEEQTNSYRRPERSSKSINKKKNKSITNHIYKMNDNENDERNDSPSNKKDFNNDNEQIYIGEKILINLDDLNFLFSKFNETNNIIDYKKGELSEENIFDKNKRLSCIINNSPFISSNIYLKNKNCNTSIEYLLGKDKCRFFEKTKNIYKGKSAKDLFKKISDDIFEEIDSTLNDKLYILDPTKTSIGQLYKSKDNYENESLKNRYIRDITNMDGNAFLKAFIFNYLERLTVKKDIQILTEIIGKIISILKSRKQSKEEISKVLAIFKIIINYLEQDSISNAYKVLIKSFSDDYIFEKMLIIFIRESLSESIISHQNYFILDNLKEIVQNKYIKKNEKEELIFDYKLYAKEVINDNNNELQYEILIYYFLAAIFDVDLIIYTNNDSKTNKIIFNHSNVEYEQNSIINIELFIKFGKISIVYSDDFYKEYIDIMPLISNSNIPLDKIKIKVNENNINCYMCKTIPNELILIDRNFQLICKKCLEKVVQKIIDKRYFLFSETDNHFFHEEFYCNKINYEINCDKINSYMLNLSIHDIQNILEKNLTISDVIHNKIKKDHKCERCKESFIKSRKAFTMEKCGDLICIQCLKDYIFKATDGKIILNYFEYKLKQIKFFCPACNKEMHLSKNLINNVYNDDKYIQESEGRLIDSARHICCFCHKIDNNKTKTKTFVIVNEFVSSNSSIDNYLLVHSACDDCFKNVKQNELNNNLKQFFCDFCEEYHQFNQIKFNIQQKRKACCSHM